MSEVFIPTEVIQYGSFGLISIVLVWFMNRYEKALSKLSENQEKATAIQERLVGKIEQLCTSLSSN